MGQRLRSRSENVSEMVGATSSEVLCSIRL